MFENISKKIVGVGKGVMRGTQTFSETVSLNARIDECKKELNNCFLQLGQAYFSRTAGNIPPEYQGIFERIHMLNQTIQQLQEQIKMIKGIRQCPNCGAEVASNVMFCGNCGFSMPPVQNSAPVNGPVCSSCGAPLEEDALFCTNCGTRIVKETPSFQAAGSPKPAAPGKVCKNCGAPAAEDAAFCNECGTSLLTEEKNQEFYSYEEPAGQQPEETRQPESASENVPAAEKIPDTDQPEDTAAYPDFQQPEAGKVCPNCGTSLESDAVFCSECGTKVS